MDLIPAILVFLAGLALGSFLNVSISRIPRDLSVVAPRSSCPRCHTPIAWYDNIPLASWVVLKRRCRHCGGSISFRYPVVELLTPLLFVGCYSYFGFGWMLAKTCLFCLLVVGLIFMDAETGLLPAEFTYAGIVAGVVLAGFAPVDTEGTEFAMILLGKHAEVAPQLLSVLDALAAGVLGAAFFYMAWALYYIARRADGLGFGDIAFTAMIGVFLGLKLTVLVVFLSPIIATLYAIGTLPFRRQLTSPNESQGRVPPASSSFLRRQIPFGVFLGISGLVALFAGEPLWKWYLGLSG